MSSITDCNHFEGLPDELISSILTLIPNNKECFKFGLTDTRIYHICSEILLKRISLENLKLLDEIEFTLNRVTSGSIDFDKLEDCLNPAKIKLKKFVNNVIIYISIHSCEELPRTQIQILQLILNRFEHVKNVFKHTKRKVYEEMFIQNSYRNLLRP